MAEENISAAGAAEIDTLNININVESGGALAELERLKKQLDAIEKELSGVRSGTKKTAAEMDSLAKATKSSTSFLKTFATVSASVISIRYVIGTLRDFIEESSSYVENMNLFTIAMGEYAEEATAYAETVQDALGLDISEWTRAQGLLMQLATGFGVAREDAAAMSKTLTQLSYDISSYFNISTDEALTKVRSGISGEIEPLRNLGYALDEATLKRVAYDHGIEKSIESMTQAEKAQLRFIAIMEQSGNVMGDLSRTLDSPANQLRIIDQEIMRLKRSVGNFLIPMMQVTLPLITAIVDELTELSNWLANILGYEMPTFDYSNLQNAGNASGELTDGLTDATTAAKKLNSALIGIDELNVLREDTSVASALTGGSDLGIDFSQYGYDFLGNASEEARKASEEMEGLAKAILFSTGAFATLKIALDANEIVTKLSSLTKNAKNTASSLRGLFVSAENAGKSIGSTALTVPKLTAGIGLLGVGLVSTIASADDFAEAMSSGDGLGGALTGLVTGGAGMIAGGFVLGGPIGAVAGGLAALTTGLIAWSNTASEIASDRAIQDFFSDAERSIDNVKKELDDFYGSLNSSTLDDYNNSLSPLVINFESAEKNISKLFDVFSNRDRIESDDIDELAQAFQNLSDSAVNLNQFKGDSILESIKNAMNAMPAEKMGELKDVFDSISDAIDKMNANVSAAEEEFNTLLKSGTIYTEEGMARAAELQKEIVENTLSDEKIGFYQSLGGFKSSINLGSTEEEILENIGDLQKQASEYIAQATSVYDENLKSITAFYGMGVISEQEYESVKDAFDLAKANLSNEVQEKLSDTIKGAIVSYVENIAEQVSGKSFTERDFGDAVSELERLSGRPILGKIFPAFSYEYADSYGRDFIESFATDFDRVGISGAVGVADVFDTLVTKYSEISGVSSSSAWQELAMSYNESSRSQKESAEREQQILNNLMLATSTLQEIAEKDTNIFIGDEVIGRANSRYQSTYGEKLNSGSYDGGY